VLMPTVRWMPILISYHECLQSLVTIYQREPDQEGRIAEIVSRCIQWLAQWLEQWVNQPG